MRRGLLSFVFIVSIVPSMGQDVTIYGPAMANSIFQDLRATFLLTHTERVAYTAVQEDAYIDSYLAAGQPVVVTQPAAVSHSSLTIPMLGFPIVVVYNIRGTTIQLSQQLVIDIFGGRVTNWNDTELARINPKVTFPDQPITLITGSVLDTFVEGMSVIAGRPFNITSNRIDAQNKVCAKIKSIPYSMGVSWMGDALMTSAQMALLENRDGYFVSPVTGAAIALSEYYSTKEDAAPGDVVTLYNLHGRRTWPLMGLLSIIFPEAFGSCLQLRTLQSFIASVMFRTENMDTLVEVAGWQPTKALRALDDTLGSIEDEPTIRTQLYHIPCSQGDVVASHIVGATSEMTSPMLKMLAAYASELDDSLLLSSSSNMTILLEGMIPSDGNLDVVDIDLTMTWDFVVHPYPQFLGVPVFMGAVAPFVNFDGDQPPILTTALIAAIYAGNITNWNDPRIQILNPSVVLPSKKIIVLASRYAAIDGRTSCFERQLRAASPGFSWSSVNITVQSSRDVLNILGFTPFSIGYAFGTQVDNAAAQVPRLLGATNQPVLLSSDSLAACWISLKHPNCWPMVAPVSLALRRPGMGVPCSYEKHPVDFAAWIMKRTQGVHPLLVPNAATSYNLGQAEYCNGRSLLVTNPEPQALSSAAKYLVYILSAVGLLWTACQAIAIVIARHESQIKSASALFSLLAVVGSFLILLAPILIVQDSPTVADCGSSVWFLVLGFSLCYGALFAKLFRLYTIFTTRKLVVPRLSNKRLLIIVFIFVVVDVILLLIYSIMTPPEPYNFSASILSTDDLVTGRRVFTLEMCSFHINSPVLYVILIIKFLVALGGAGMAFSIRQVDKRFTSTSALGWGFYNLFLTCGIAIVIVSLQADDNLEFYLFTPVFCGLWIVYITLIALTLDSNILLACKGVSKPLRRMLGSKDSASKETSKEGDAKKTSIDKHEDSNSGTIFVVNREMFPSQYDKFEGVLLEQILEELNFQRNAVRKALINTSTGASTMVDTIEITKPDGHRTTFQGSPSLQGRRSDTAGRSSPVSQGRRSETGKTFETSGKPSIDIPELAPIQLSRDPSDP